MSDARGPYGQSCVGRLLAGQKAARVRVVGSHGAALGRGDGQGATDARGPYGRRSVGRLLAGRKTARVRVK
jgi:hypothetical protein